MAKCILKTIREITQEDTGIKITDEPEVLDIRIWSIPKSAKYPLGINYSVNYRIGVTPIIRYDNDEDKGDHRHIFGKEESVEFKSYKEIIKEILRIRKEKSVEILEYYKQEVRLKYGKKEDL